MKIMLCSLAIASICEEHVAGKYQHAGRLHSSLIKNIYLKGAIFDNQFVINKQRLLHAVSHLLAQDHKWLSEEDPGLTIGKE